jgi:predicted dehydrogenase
MERFTGGVVGIGDIVEVVACAGRSLEKAQQKAAQHGIPRACADAAELIADPDGTALLQMIEFRPSNGSQPHVRSRG